MLMEFGMDYGVKPRMMLLSDISFVENFQKAKCLAVGYISCPDASGEKLIGELGFFFAVEEYGRKFMENLLRWVKESGDDGDAVDLEFIELKNDEYLLAISPNQDRFLKRMLPNLLKDRVAPLLTIASQAKGGMTIGNYYRQFKNQYVSGRRIVIRNFFGKGGKIDRVGDEYFIKTQFKFSKEGELLTDSMGTALLSKRNKPFNPKDHLRKGGVDMGRIEDVRMAELKYFFPLTLDKIVDEGWLKDIVESMPRHIGPKETIQAICNIILLERLKIANPNDIAMDGPGYQVSLVLHLLNTPEVFDSYFPPDGLFTRGLIRNQVKRDKDYLSDYLKKE